MFMMLKNGFAGAESSPHGSIKLQLSPVVSIIIRTHDIVVFIVENNVILIEFDIFGMIFQLFR